MSDGVEVYATKGQIEDFKESLLWKDIVRELDKWKQGFAEEMFVIVETSHDENPSSASVLMHLGDLHGRAKAVDYLQQLPDIFLEIVKSKSVQNSNEEEKANGDDSD